jgi:tetratricopeptide (TPR) repeat protein
MATTTRTIGIRFAVLILLLAGTRLLVADEAQADSLLQQGRVDEAAAMLHETLGAQPGDAVAHQLLCRVYYSQDMADPAIHECELAVSNAPSDSDDQMWLGRAYGLKAAHASPFSALGLAKKVHVAFERAVQLDPENVHAMNDLGEYYVSAPSMVGGGLDKAEALAEKMKAHSVSQYHRLLALIAEKKKDFPAAETEFKNAVAAGKAPEAYIDLGHFYVRQHQPDKAVGPLKAGIDADRKKDAVLVDAASILTSAQREPQLAESLLREYLASPAKSDAAPAFKVHVQLGNLLAQAGDSAGAHGEYAAAVALASQYAPARKAMQGSK